MQLLRDIYPGIDWKRVDFYEGLPWFTSLVAPFVTAQALPDFYSFGRYKIYLKCYDESKTQCVADIVHEGFHVLQAMSLLNGYGLGILRGFYLVYIAQYMKHGYRSHPLEIPAYDQEYRFLDFCRKHSLQVPVNTSALKKELCASGLVFKKTAHKYSEGLLRMLGSLTLCLLTLLLKPPLDAIIFLVHLSSRRQQRLVRTPS
jgi:hypothetical protein